MYKKSEQGQLKTAHEQGFIAISSMLKEIGVETVLSKDQDSDFSKLLTMSSDAPPVFESTYVTPQG